jgi:hypothetical protein
MRNRSLLLITAMLLVCGLAADVLLTRPALMRTRRLTAQREKALKQFDQLRARDDERNLLAAVLGASDLEEVIAGRDETDGFVFLGEALAAAGLERLELATQESGASRHLRRSRFSLLARGGYDQVLLFLRSLEQSGRLVTVDVVKIDRVIGGKQLECRLNISIYDVQGEVAS